MDVVRWRRIERVLDAALGVAPVKWPALLDRACAGDPQLRQELDTLLALVPTAREFLATPPSALAAALLEEAHGMGSYDAEAGAEQRGDVEPGARRGAGRIGPYRILREIGRGGMGRVFLAERADGQFEQEVALKLLRPGLDTDIDRERFRSERQILASLNHPNIARLLDGGVGDDGQPYLVMEHVEGLPIDAYCDERGLAVEQRLELFLTVADAVQYAHRKLVVHRDLKPSNILVGRDGRVKLLDFGLAKLVDPASARECARSRWLTREYAAPEQLRDDAISTLTDVYQLGAVLYHLLTGSSPVGPQEERFREIRSSGHGGVHQAPSIVAARAHRIRLNPLRGDLDAIVLKALRTSPEDRYASAEALAEDLRRHLVGRPVRARPPTLWYLARRFVRRRRIETMAAAALVLSLLTGVGISVSQARRAAAERDRAEAASREAAGVTSFLLGLFEVSDPAEARGDILTAADLADRGVARAERLGGQPSTQASMLEVTSRLYMNLGRFGDAHAVLERALELRRSDGVESLPVAGTLTQLSGALVRLGRYDAADSLTREALVIQQRLLGSQHPDLATTLHQLASLAIFQGDLISAEAHHRRALAVRARALGPEDSLTALSRVHLGASLARRGRLDAAEEELRRGLATLERVLGAEHAETANAMLQIVYLIGENPSRLAEAEALCRRALEIRRGVFGDGHPMVAYARYDLAHLLLGRGDTAAAVPLGREYLRDLRRAYGTEHPVIATATSQLAKILHQADALGEAEMLFREALAMERRLRGDDFNNVAGHQIDLARLLIDRGRLAEAETLLRDAIRIREQAAGSEHPTTELARGTLGMLMTRMGDHRAADSLLRLAIRSMERQIAPEHPDLRQLEAWLAHLRQTRGRSTAPGARVGKGYPSRRSSTSVSRARTSGNPLATTASGSMSR